MKEIHIKVSNDIFVTVTVSEEKIWAMTQILKEIHNETTQTPVEGWSVDTIAESAAVKMVLNTLPDWLYAHRNYPEFGQTDWKPFAEVVLQSSENE